MSGAFAEKLHKHRDDLRDASTALFDLAHAFEQVGNQFVADKLYEIGNGIDANADGIVSVYNKQLSNGIKDDMEALADALLSVAIRKSGGDVADKLK